MTRGVLRLTDRAISEEETAAILAEAREGFLGTTSPGGEPYVVPVNFVYREGKIYFHCAVAGQKLDNIRTNPRVCFTVVGESKVVPEKRTTTYRSVIAFGQARLVEEYGPKHTAVQWIMHKYAPQEECRFEANSPRDQRTMVVEIKVEHLTGKQNQR